ncbi:hypothetical protein [Actinocrispum sp. NPDC049592]|uniref:hypothetical protein n=1 Tax=Actinocrispum sp. NPDC049592 TaxID=3154835 RepID=UPI0034227931
MSMIQWERLDPATIESAVKALLVELYPDARPIDGRGGDGGRDVRWDSPAGLVIFEIKSFAGERLKPQQRREIEKSLARAAGHRPSRWVLIVPTDHSPSEEAWFDRLIAAHPDIALEWRGVSWLNNQFGKREYLRRLVEAESYELLRLAQQFGHEAVVSTSVAAVPVRELTDPFVLEVHRPVVLDGQQPDLPLLPVYVPRAHDIELRRAVEGAARGHSAMVVLVGGSSTGKTRACWEAIQTLPDDWRLWHPFDPTRIEAALAGLPRVGPRTVVWLNELQFYLHSPGSDAGERVATALRTLLTDPARGPVLVLGTLWPQHWDTFTRGGPADEADRHAHVRAVLAGTDIAVPGCFTGAALPGLRRAAATDSRLARAAAEADSGQITQYLAGVPELLSRYHNAPAPARALICAAIDAYRLGAGPALSPALLAAAAPGYLTDVEWDQTGEAWLDQALAYVTAPCKGVRGPLTRVRRDREQVRYQLSDYLEQTGRRDRADVLPPDTFWEAVAAWADPSTLGTLALEAQARGLWRHAALLYQRAPTGAVPLIALLHSIDPAEAAAVARQAAGNVDLTDTRAVTHLLDALRHADANDAVEMLLARDPGAHADITDPVAVAVLLEVLRDLDAQDAIEVVLTRDLGACVDLTFPDDVVLLVEVLRRVGADAVMIAPLADVCAPVSPASDDPWMRPDVDWDLAMLRGRADHGLMSASHARDIEAGVIRPITADLQALMRELRKAGERDAIAALRPRDRYASFSRSEPHHDPVEPPWGWTTTADEAVLGLLASNSKAYPGLYPPDVVFDLLEMLEADAGGQALTALRELDLADPLVPANLLYLMVLEAEHPERGAGRQAAMTVLLARDPGAHADLTHLPAAGYLLGMLHFAGAHEAADALQHRIGQVDLTNPLRLALLLRALRDGFAEHVAATFLDRVGEVELTDSLGVCWLIRALRETGTPDAMTQLLARDPAAQADPANLPAVAYLLGALHGAGQQQAVTRLLDRLAHADLTTPRPSAASWKQCNISAQRTRSRR